MCGALCSPACGPCPLPPPPPGGGVTVTWPMNNKKSMGNHRRRRKILVGYTRVQVTVVWWRGTAIPRGGRVRNSSALVELSSYTVLLLPFMNFPCFARLFRRGWGNLRPFT